MGLIKMRCRACDITYEVERESFKGEFPRQPQICFECTTEAAYEASEADALDKPFDTDEPNLFDLDIEIED